MIRTSLETALQTTLDQIISVLALSPLPQNAVESLRFERPRNKEHGDYAVNVSPLAKLLKLPPPKIAEMIHEAFPDPAFDRQVIAGFINFKLPQPLLAESLVRIIRNPAPGINQSQADSRILLEYVSANPTGPLHIGHGRWAALGNSLQRILTHCGSAVTAEFYINDAGVQMQRIGVSLAYRLAEQLQTGVTFPSHPGGEAPYPYYPGEYVTRLAERFLAALSNTKGQEDIATEAINRWNGQEETLPEAFLETLKAYARTVLLQEQKELLERLGIPFDQWFSESDMLHRQGAVEAVIAKLTARGWTYEAEGAVWFKSSAFGDEKDRVLIKSDGSYTYLTADIAYHEEKFSRRDPAGQPCYNKIINIWGADHHGYIPRLRGAIAALGHDPDQFEVLLGQLVNLIIGGEKTRMGKRRKMLTLEDVIEEVGVDATRFWMVSKSADTTLDFDMELAASACDENPVFYAQYAHARCASILRNAVQENVDIQAGGMAPPFVTEAALSEFAEQVSAERLIPLFGDIEDEKAQELLKTLILRLDGFEDIVKDAARNRAPHLIARYTLDLAADFHSFYAVCRILTPDREITQRRLMVIVALKKVLAQALHLLGVSAPEKM